jgi:CDGSH-type Zn-finger protein
MDHHINNLKATMLRMTELRYWQANPGVTCLCVVLACMFVWAIAGAGSDGSKKKKVRANNAGVPSTMPPAEPSRRVDFANPDEMRKKSETKPVSMCRCYKSKTFPYCDGSHRDHNASTGDNVGPVIVHAGLDNADGDFRKNWVNAEPAAAEGTLAAAAKGALTGPKLSPADVMALHASLQGKGRANNYGVRSTFPPDQPASKRVTRIDLVSPTELAERASDGPVALCRCFRSATFPLCDGSHNAHNAETGDNAGPLVVKT